MKFNISYEWPETVQWVIYQEYIFQCCICSTLPLLCRKKAKIYFHIQKYIHVNIWAEMNHHSILLLKAENINTQFLKSCNGNRTKRERRCVTSATYDKVPISVFTNLMYLMSTLYYIQCLCKKINWFSWQLCWTWISEQFESVYNLNDLKMEFLLKICFSIKKSQRGKHNVSLHYLKKFYMKNHKEKIERGTT